VELGGFEPPTSWVRYRPYDLTGGSFGFVEPRSLPCDHLRFAHFGSTDGRFVRRPRPRETAMRGTLELGRILARRGVRPVRRSAVGGGLVLPSAEVGGGLRHVAFRAFVLRSDEPSAISLAASASCLPSAGSVGLVWFVEPPR
jgi:hypothetical protein